MTPKRLFTTVIPGLAAAVLGLAPMAASAAAIDHDILAFKSGTAKITAGTCTAPNPNAVCWKGGSGNYSFSTAGGTCEYASSDGANPLTTPPFDTGNQEVPEIGACPSPVTSTGTFHNTRCGTGSADGTSTISEGADAGASPPGKNPSDTYTYNYHIGFTGGIGIIEANVHALDQFGNPTGVTSPATSSSEAEDSTEPGLAIGVVVISPDSSFPVTTDVNGSGACTTGFIVQAVVVSTQ